MKGQYQFNGAWTFTTSCRAQIIDRAELQSKPPPIYDPSFRLLQQAQLALPFAKTPRKSFLDPCSRTVGVGQYDLDNSLSTRIPHRFQASGRYAQKPSATTEVDFPKNQQKSRGPSKSFGYAQDHKYSNNVPAVGLYQINRKQIKPSNVKQVMLSTSERTNLCRYGPAVGQYDAAGEEVQVRAPSYSFNKANRFRAQKVGPGPGDYRVQQRIGKQRFPQRGQSVQPRLVADRSTPGPVYDIVNPEGTGVRFGKQIKKSCFEEYSSISKVHSYIEEHGQSGCSVKIGDGLRPRVEKPGPAPTDYLNPAVLASTLGKFSRSARKQPKLSPTVGPADYSPNLATVLCRSPRPSFNRNQFSYDFKFVNKNVGPGLYPLEYVPKNKLAFGFGTGTRTPRVRPTPGPGDYEVRDTIGSIPNYGERREKGKLKSIAGSSLRAPAPTK